MSKTHIIIFWFGMESQSQSWGYELVLQNTERTISQPSIDTTLLT